MNKQTGICPGMHTLCSLRISGSGSHYRWFTVTHCYTLPHSRRQTSTPSNPLPWRTNKETLHRHTSLRQQILSSLVTNGTSQRIQDLSVIDPSQPLVAGVFTLNLVDTCYFWGQIRAGFFDWLMNWSGVKCELLLRSSRAGFKGSFVVFLCTKHPQKTVTVPRGCKCCGKMNFPPTSDHFVQQGQCWCWWICLIACCVFPCS